MRVRCERQEETESKKEGKRGGMRMTEVDRRSKKGKSDIEIFGKGKVIERRTETESGKQRDREVALEREKEMALERKRERNGMRERERDGY